MNSTQIKALAGFMDAVEAACVEHGVILGEHDSFKIEVSDGQGDSDTAVLYCSTRERAAEDDNEDEEWHLEVVSL